MAKIDPILLMQTDPKWANNDYSAPGEKTTIKAEGCGIACSAMVIASLADKNITPADTAEWSKAHGYKAKNQGTQYSYFAPQFAKQKLKCEMLNSKNCYHDGNAPCHKKAKQALLDGDWVIAVMGKGDFTSSGHYVLLYRLDGNDVLIRDPQNKKEICSRMDWDKAKYQVKYYWHIEVPKKYKEEEEVVETIEIKVDGKKIPVDVIYKDNRTYIKTRDIADALGYEVGAEGKIPVLTKKK